MKRISSIRSAALVCFKTNQNATRPSEHCPARGGKCQNSTLFCLFPWSTPYRIKNYSTSSYHGIFTAFSGLFATKTSPGHQDIRTSFTRHSLLLHTLLKGGSEIVDHGHNPRFSLCLFLMGGGERGGIFYLRARCKICGINVTSCVTSFFRLCNESVEQSR